MFNDYFYKVKESFLMWKFWVLTGWPNKRRCPQCAGEGFYSTEVMAQYGDKPEICGMCNGNKYIRR